MSKHVITPAAVKPRLAREDDFHYTHYAKLFAEVYASKARFVLKASKGTTANLDGDWLVWDDQLGHWVSDPVRVRTMARELAEVIVERSTELFASVKMRREIRKVLNNPSLILGAAAGLPEMVVTPDDLDANPFLLKVKNGTLDLTLVDSPEGPLREDRPEDLITLCAGANYDPDAQAPLWQKYLDRVMPDPSLQEVLQTMVGYSLSGDSSAHAFWLLEGRSRAGKGVFKNTIKALMGEYAYEGNFSEFLTNGHRKEGPRPGILEMFGKRLVFASEASQAERLDDAIIKGITGSDVIRVRGLYERSTTGKVASFKVALLSNHAPIVDAADEAIWERVRRVPWTQYIPREERNVNLEDELLDELSGILNWALDGFRYWHRNRSLPFPEVLVASNEQYRDEMDPLSLWLEECIGIDEDGEVLNTHLLESYTDWARRYGARPIEMREFGKRLKNHPKLDGRIQPFRKTISGKTERGYQGITIVKEPF